ncbi:hypothetical protein BYT27DRAFT_6613282 [Phlegmacium glaucopus]|nr:hypothetical protein BYT27DRAFT_6613282 [Phlegmacium glaucopus]
MVSCCICIEQSKNPVSLPCGHIFCTNCIVKAIRVVKHSTNFHPCPVCRSVYNIAPVNLRMVPPNLRSFVTPSIRRLYIDSHSPEQEEENHTLITSTSSEISRLQAENHALRNHCTMWRRRAEMQGLANLKLTHTIRDQASQLAHERDEPDRRCSRLKRKPDDDESRILVNATSSTSHEWPAKTEEPLPSSMSPFPTPFLSFIPMSSRHSIDEAIPPKKRLRIDPLPEGAAERIAVWQKEVLDSISSP